MPKLPKAKKGKGPQLFRNFITFVVMVVVVGAVFSLVNEPGNSTEEITLSQLVEKVEAGEVKQIEVKGEQALEIVLNDDTVVTARKETGQPITELLVQQGVSEKVIRQQDIIVTSNTGFTYWLSMLSPGLISILVIGLILWFMLRQVQGANNKAMMFGRSGAKEEKGADKKNKVTFKDVAGATEAKEELQEVVDFLKHPQKYSKLGAKVPSGVLLVGSPGTGKTLMARAVSGEADVPFYHISGSEFVEMFVGVGASRVRDLFKKAKQNAPAIVFVDEIDAVGRQRGTGLGGSHDEREQTLNQILVEMDGFDNETRVIVIAATNRPDVLDPALLRPGRFDRHVTIDLPDIKEREQILKVHSANKPLDKDAELKAIAQRTPGFSGADLENILNEAAILTAREDRKSITMKDCLDAIEKVMMGPERKSAVINEEEKKITAYHEGGHALVAHFSKDADPVHKISIISRGRAGGYTLKLPERDKSLHTKAEFLADLAVMLGGRVAEEQIFGEITTGASNDLQKATKLARLLVTQYGMSEDLGPRTFGHREEVVFLGKELSEQRDYSEDTAKRIDTSVDELIDSAYKVAKSILHEHSKELEELAKVLMEKETLERKEFEVLMASVA
ncbi:MAG: ATP-dependent zinc metalloprotease FtsH [bacterium]|nr:ATP-dependent zinc metalloprotease FtsH [bacterium]